MAKRKGNKVEEKQSETAALDARNESVSEAVAAAALAAFGVEDEPEQNQQPEPEQMPLDTRVEFAAEEASFAEDESELIAADLGEAEADLEGADLEAVGVEDAGELSDFESAEVELVEEISDEQLMSVLESMLFATDRPQSVAVLKSAFQGTKIRSADIRRALDRLQMEYANPLRGVTLEEVAGGYQLRTKPDNQTFLQRTIKARPFRLSGPALEVLAIVAYKQPCTKAMVDEIRGVESGHLMRGLLDRGLLHFAGKSELPGRPMFYETTRKFLEIFGLRNISELPTLNEIDQLIPEGIGEVVEEKQTLSDLTGELSTEVVAKTYSEGEEELLNISEELQSINTSSDFFEDEKRRQREKRDADRAQDIQERLTVGEVVEEKDKRWLARYEAEKLESLAALTAIAPLIDQAAVAVDQTLEAVTSLSAEAEAEVAAAEVAAPAAEPAALDFDHAPTDRPAET